MTQKLPLATLCELCQQIFLGHWSPKESLRPPSRDGDGSPGQIARLENSNDETLSDEVSLVDSDGSFGDGWYEDPDWVKVIAGDQMGHAPSGLALSHSPRHHSIQALEESAFNGCHLCARLWDIVPHKVSELESHGRDNASRSLGIVIIRPSNGETVESAALEVSYFVDGKITRDSYVFTVGIQLVGRGGVDSLFSNSPMSKLTKTAGLEINPSQIQDNDNKLPSGRSLQQISLWLSECSTEHEECHDWGLGVLSNRRLPTRLLVVEPSEASPKVFLCESKDLDITTRYATLSHCWGSAPIIQLLSSCYGQFTQNIPFGSLSRTFQDAVIFTKALGVRYIWIDSLCIIQDSKEDWLREALLMASVYSNSWVNFAATSSTDGSGGLFYPTNALLSQPCLVDASWTNPDAGMYLCVDETAWRRRVEDGPLNKRGWVFQERILAPRTIHCAYDQLWWTCADAPTSCSEEFPYGVPLQASRSIVDFMTDLRHSVQGDPISSNESWLAIVKGYTRTNLTYESDKLVALAGAAETAMKIMGIPKDSYLAGHWRVDLMMDLLWRMASTGVRPAEYRAPSWSWASVDGEVYFHSSEVRNKNRENLLINMVEGRVSSVGDPLGPVTSGHLIVQGPLVKIQLSHADSSTYGYGFLDRLRFGHLDLRSDSGFAESIDHEPLYHDWSVGGKEVYFACFSSTPKPQNGEESVSEGLLLEPTGVSHAEYRRIGWLRIFHSPPARSIFADASRSNALEAYEYLQIDGGFMYTYKII